MSVNYKVLYNNCFEIARGVADSASFVGAKKCEDEIKQGGNYLFSSLCALFQYSQIGSCFPSRITDQITSPLTKKAVSTLPYIGASLHLAVPLFKNESFFSWKILNKVTDNPYLTKLFHYVAEYGTDVLHAAMTTALIASFILSPGIHEGVLLGSLLYNYSYNFGLIPSYVQASLEKYNIFFEIIRAFSSSRLAIAVALISLSLKSSLFSHFLDKSLFKSKDDFTLEEIDTPYKETPLKFETFKKVIEGKANWQLNPSQMSLDVNDLYTITPDHEFSKLSELSNLFDNENFLALAEKKFSGDEHFLDELSGISNTSEQFVKSSFQEALQAACQKEGLSKKQYIKRSLNTRLESLIKVLKKEVPVKGSEILRTESIELFSKILPLVTKIKDEIQQLRSEIKTLKKDPTKNQKLIEVKRQLLKQCQREYEDAALSICIEAGDYCILGVKITANALLDTLFLSSTQKTTDNIPTSRTSPYMAQFFAELKQERYRLLNKTYQKVASLQNLPLYNDKHCYNSTIRAIGLGFYPFSEEERNQLDFSTLINWKLFYLFRTEMYKEYEKTLWQKLDSEEPVKKFGFINARLSEGMSEEEREQAEDFFTFADLLTPEEYNKRLNTLFGAYLGVIKISD